MFFFLRNVFRHVARTEFRVIFEGGRDGDYWLMLCLLIFPRFFHWSRFKKKQNNPRPHKNKILEWVSCVVLVLSIGTEKHKYIYIFKNLSVPFSIHLARKVLKLKEMLRKRIKIIQEVKLNAVLFSINFIWHFHPCKIQDMYKYKLKPWLLWFSFCTNFLKIFSDDKYSSKKI